MNLCPAAMTQPSPDISGKPHPNTVDKMQPFPSQAYIWLRHAHYIWTAKRKSAIRKERLKTARIPALIHTASHLSIHTTKTHSSDLQFCQRQNLNSAWDTCRELILISPLFSLPLPVNPSRFHSASSTHISVCSPRTAQFLPHHTPCRQGQFKNIPKRAA